MNWIIAIVITVIIGFLLDREIYFYEGVHLGPRFNPGFTTAGRRAMMPANAKVSYTTRTCSPYHCLKN